MALIVNDRVRESTTVTGTGTATLLGAIAGYQAFSVIGNGNTCYYTISDQLGANWEVGIGTYTLSGTTLARTTVLKSSNANALVNFTAGTKDVFVTYPAETSVSGGGGGTYPTVQPSLNLDFANSKQLDPRITFVRNSIAAYYDGQTTAMAEQNLLLQSNTFSNAAWVATNGTVASGVTDPAGTTTAFSFTATGVATLYQTLTTTATPYTLSFYIQRVTGTGAVNLTLDGTTLTAQTITGSWARYSVTATPTAASHTIGIQLAVSGDAVNIFSSQLENRSSMTAYTPTTSSPITNYIPVLMTAPAGVARFDCDPITGNSLGLLIEESRTNLLNYSSDFSNAAWEKGSSTFYHNYVIAPDGTQTATLVGPTVSILPYHSATWVPGVTYVYSVYVKAITGKTIRFRMSGVTTGDELRTFTASTGTIVSVGGVDVGSETATLVGNGWYRVVMVSVARADYSNYVSIEAGQGFAIWGAQLEVSGTTQAIRTSTIGVGSTTTDIVLDASASSVDGTYVGNKLTIVNLAQTITAYVGATKTATVSVAFASAPSSGATYYITPATMVVAGFATSYIPTTTTALTRAADQASMTVSGWYNQSQGSFFVVYNGGRESIQNGYGRVIGLNSTAITFLCSNGSSSAITAWSGSQAVNLNVVGANFWDTGGKAAMSYSPIITIVAGNGVYATIDNPTISFSSIPLSLITIGGGPQYLNGHIRKLSYYPVALSSSELVALTS